MEYSELWRFTRRRIRDDVHVADGGEFELESASTKTLDVEGETCHALCGHNPDVHYVNCSYTHQVFTSVSGFAVGEILIDYGLEIASETLSPPCVTLTGYNKITLLTRRTCATTWTTSERQAFYKARRVHGEVRLVPVALRRRAAHSPRESSSGAGTRILHGLLESQTPMPQC
jgi:hypothetical protein